MDSDSEQDPVTRNVFMGTGSDSPDPPPSFYANPNVEETRMIHQISFPNGPNNENVSSTPSPMTPNFSVTSQQNVAQIVSSLRRNNSDDLSNYNNEIADGNLNPPMEEIQVQINKNANGFAIQMEAGSSRAHEKRKKNNLSSRISKRKQKAKWDERKEKNEMMERKNNELEQRVAQINQRAKSVENECVRLTQLIREHQNYVAENHSQSQQISFNLPSNLNQL